MQRLLRLGCVGNKKSCVKPARLTNGRYPVTDIVDRTGDELQTLALTEFDHVQRRVMHTSARRGEAILRCDIIERHNSIRFRITSEQHARFFKTLTNCRHPIGETATWYLQNCARVIVVEPITKRFERLGAVGRVDFATWKHIHAAGKCCRVCALQHEYFKTIFDIANQHHGGCWSQCRFIVGRRMLVDARTCHDKIVRLARTANRIEKLGRFIRHSAIGSKQ